MPACRPSSCRISAPKPGKIPGRRSESINGQGERPRSPRTGSILAEEVLDARLEGDGDLVERRNRRARFRALDLRKKRHAEARSPGHLLEREVLFFAQIADRVADD